MYNENRILSLKILLSASLLAAATSCNQSQIAVEPPKSDASQNTNPRVAFTASKVPSKEVIPPGVKEDSAHKERYTNFGYGFSIPVPKGLVAYSNQPPAPAHGAGIVLSENPDSYLYVDGSYNASLYNSLDEAMGADFGYLKDDYADAEIIRKEPTRLNKLSALRYTAKYKRQGENRVQDCVIAFRNVGKDLTIIYTASVDTVDTRYLEDVASLEQIMGGWKLIKVE